MKCRLIHIFFLNWKQFSQNFQEFSLDDFWRMIRRERFKKRKSLQGNATRKLIYSANANNVDEDSIRPWRVEIGTLSDDIGTRQETFENGRAYSWLKRVHVKHVTVREEIRFCPSHSDNLLPTVFRCDRFYPFSIFLSLYFFLHRFDRFLSYRGIYKNKNRTIFRTICFWQITFVCSTVCPYLLKA